MNAIQKFIEAEHKYLDLKEITYKEYEQTIAPLRDVECVVRCKDCKRYYEEAHECEALNQGCIKPNFFCGYAERKDGDGDD